MSPTKAETGSDVMPLYLAGCVQVTHIGRGDRTKPKDLRSAQEVPRVTDRGGGGGEGLKERTWDLHRTCPG